MIYLLSLLAWAYVQVAVLAFAMSVVMAMNFPRESHRPLWKSFLAALVWPLPWAWKYL